MNMPPDGDCGAAGGGGTRRSSRRPSLRVVLLLALLLLFLAALAAAAEGQRAGQQQQRQLRRRRKQGGGDKDTGQNAPVYRDDNPNVHGKTGMALGESLEPTTFLLQTECGKVRSGPLLDFQDRDWDEQEIGESTTVVVPFYGLRYAAPLASAEQRWRPPEPGGCPFFLPSPTVHSASGEKSQPDDDDDDDDRVYDSGAYRGPCVQADGTGVEDCLFLNVFSPLATLQALATAAEGPHHRHQQAQRLQPHTTEGSNNKAKTNASTASVLSRAEESSGSELLLPVVVYIHGGGLMTGAAKGSPLAAIAGDPRFGPVVAVSLDHRLNVFGFLALRELSEEQDGASGNYGLMDQLAALEWVQKHIRAFGGDPDRVTLIGHSSGGTSILALMGSPLAKGLFHRAFSLSGSPNITISLPDAEAQNAGIMRNGPCAHQNSTAERLTCLRGLPTPTLLGLIPHNWSTPGIWDLPSDPKGQHYGGLPVVDGRVLARPLLEALEAGIVDVPFLLGGTGHEGDCCTPLNLRNASAVEWAALLEEQFLPWGQGPALGERIAGFYLPEAREDPQKALTAFMADYGLICGASEAASRASQSPLFASPVYTYVNQWGPSTPIPRGGNHPGMSMHYAFHGWDLTSWLRDYPAGYEPSPLDLQHSRLLRQAVYQFARDGHLHGTPPPGAQPLGWDAVDAVPGATVSVYVIQPPSAPSQGQVESGSGMVVGYKADICEFYRTHGLWQPFWWAN